MKLQAVLDTNVLISELRRMNSLKKSNRCVL